MTAADIRKDGITLTVESDGTPSKIEADVALVAVGRRARTEDLGLDKVLALRALPVQNYKY